MKPMKRVLHAFYNHPAAIQPEKLQDIQTFLERRVLGAPSQTLEDDDWPAPAAGPRESAGVRMAGRVALLPLMGVVAQRMNLLMAISGGTSTELFGRALDELVADKTVSAIVMVIDSPGGSVFGVEELARKILKARDEKRIVAIADSMAASAAYWLAAQAGELVVTPSGMVGSVGVVAVHRDESKKDELAGVKTTLIHAGQYKTEGNFSQPLSAEGADHIQRTVDEYYGMFVAALARGRGVSEAKVRSDFGQGRTFLAKEAVSRGMADRIGTLEQVLHRLNRTSPGQAAVKARAIEVAGRIDIEKRSQQPGP